MAQEIQLASGSTAKTRSFLGFIGLCIITLGVYQYYWYFQINDELKEIGRGKGDSELAGSKPINSLLALLFGSMLIIPPLLSSYRTGKRIKRAEELGGVKHHIHPGRTFLCLFPFGLLIIPAFFWLASITRHQNRAILAARASVAR